MPHKRNPVLSENLCGLARIVRSAVVPALENVTLWHERDISHSSVERAIGPDATVTLDFALMRLAGMMEKLLVLSRADAGQLGKPRRRGASGEVLLALTKAGILREDAYRIVQSCAMATWTRRARRRGDRFGKTWRPIRTWRGWSSRRNWTRRWTRRCICGRWTGYSSGCSGRLHDVDRDRGEPYGSAPPTPPGIRVTTTAVRSSYAEEEPSQAGRPSESKSRFEGACWIAG